MDKRCDRRYININMANFLHYVAERWKLVQSYKDGDNVYLISFHLRAICLLPLSAL